ncbi:hypothetical protein Bca52824_087658 [Brassica carinata]|uniref:Uncharacterized protein n=1 Tax=Brassica carinata TaxID=52824 RepID=A0A8X7PB95_BRACI|nr:hypothetical protein Bca52824_087658 [Brassica carinata]
MFLGCHSWDHAYAEMALSQASRRLCGEMAGSQSPPEACVELWSKLVTGCGKLVLANCGEEGEVMSTSRLIVLRSLRHLSCLSSPVETDSMASLLPSPLSSRLHEKASSFVGQKIHALVRTPNPNLGIPCKLYSAGGDISSARQVLDETPEKQKVVL